MHIAATSDWRFEFVLSRDVRTAAARSEISRREARGELVRVTRGAYLPSSLWKAADRDERFRMRIRAVLSVASEELTLSHASAAAIWRLPWFGPWPDRIDAVTSRSYGGHSTDMVRRHVPGSDSEPVVIDGIRVTSLARTVVDIARWPGFSRAVVVGDAALNDKTRQNLAAPAFVDDDILHAELQGGRTRYAASRAHDVLTFLDGRSASPGESVSRTSIWRAGLPPPVLQQAFSPWFVDFWWPDSGLIGEFDGDAKYLDQRFRAGRSPAEVFLDEKAREDSLRRRSRGFARWGWDVARSPSALASRLLHAGLRSP